MSDTTRPPATMREGRGAWAQRTQHLGSDSNQMGAAGGPSSPPKMLLAPLAVHVRGRRFQTLMSSEAEPRPSTTATSVGQGLPGGPHGRCSGGSGSALHSWVSHGFSVPHRQRQGTGTRATSTQAPADLNDLTFQTTSLPGNSTGLAGRKRHESHTPPRPALDTGSETSSRSPRPRRKQPFGKEDRCAPTSQAWTFKVSCHEGRAAWSYSEPRRQAPGTAAENHS